MTPQPSASDGWASVRKVRGGAFEDILDGYFPFREAVAQLLRRHGFARAWLTVTNAPVMDIQGLAPTDPIPFRLRKTPSGMIEWVTVEATLTDGETRIRGFGDWWWIDAERETRRFSDLTRLGEPAFVTGIGVAASQEELGHGDVALVRLTTFDDSEASLADTIGRLGWTGATAWGFGDVPSGIERLTPPMAEGTLLGKVLARTGPGPAGAAHVVAPIDGESRNYLLLEQRTGAGRNAGIAAA